MDWGTIISGFLTGGGAGAVTGIFGSAIGGLFSWLNRKQDAKEAKAARDHELALYDRQEAANASEREFELDKLDAEHENKVGEINTRGQWRGLEASYGLDLVSEHCSRWVNNIKALYRPLLTTLLVIATWVIIYWLMNADQEILSGENVNALVKYCIMSVAYTASTAAMWWFGDRALKPPSHK